MHIFVIHSTISPALENLYFCKEAQGSGGGNVRFEDRQTRKLWLKFGKKHDNIIQVQHGTMSYS